MVYVRLFGNHQENISDPVEIHTIINEILVCSYQIHVNTIFIRVGRASVVRFLKDLMERSVLLETLASELPAGTIYFGCRIVAIEMDANTKYPTLYLNDGRVIKAKVFSKANYVN